nr:helix-turn-helix domain-containing protein [Ligilactobacillus salivarius]
MIAKGAREYKDWNQKHGLTDYRSVILYELLLHTRLTQKQIVERTNLPKQSINKGILQLRDEGYLTLEQDEKDNRVKYCFLTKEGEKYAKLKIQPLLDIEEKIIMKMGKKKIEQLNELLEEWNLNFKKYKDEE